jgi:hypothetical protein
MRVFWGFAVALCVVGVACSPKPEKAAEGFQPEKGFAPPVYSQDVAGGHFERWHKDLPCKIDTIGANVRLEKVNADPHWLAAIKIVLSPLPIADEGSRAVYGVTNAAFNVGPDTAGGAILVNLSKFKVRETPETKAFDNGALGRNIPLILSWRADGTVTATVAGKTRSVRMDQPPKSVILLVTSGKGTFDTIAMGRTAPNGTCPAAKAGG